MKRKLLGAIGIVILFLGLTGGALAEGAISEAAPLDQWKEKLGLSIYLQGGFTYNFANPDPQENQLRLFDHKANNFSFDLAQVQLVREAAVGGFGFKLKLSAGETTKYIHSRGLGIKDGQVPADTNPFDLTEAFIQYNFPLGKGVKFTFGKFITFVGAEVVEARDNANYSRSFLYDYATPFSHTGLSVSYPFSEKVTTSLYLFNGWDNFEDNNTGKTVGFSLAWTPLEPLAMSFNFIYGPEQKNNNSNYRFLFDWVATIKAGKNLSFILNADYGSEQKDPNASGMDSVWTGVAGIVKYDFIDLFSLSLRAEYFDDQNGTRTGIAQKLKEITMTPEFRVFKGLIIRPEYRYDWSDQNSFNGGKGKYQHTLALGVMYSW